MRKATGLLMILASLFFAFALGTPASADPGGNNGDVKIHDTTTAVQDQRNEPHVCQFYIDGFNFDGNSSGTWRIERWAPTGSGVASSGSWGPADSSGNWHSATQILPDGHYKLFFKQTAPMTPGGEKQKVFWVECGGTTTGGSNNGGGSSDNGGGQTCSGIASMTSHSTLTATAGGVSTVTFTMSNGCAGKEVSLVSYTAPSATFTRENASEQTVFASHTGTFNNGNFTLSVNVPSCYYQVDFVFGGVIQHFGPASSNNYYSDQGRLIASLNGGMTSCSSSTTVGGGTDTSSNNNNGNNNNGNGNGNGNGGQAVLGVQTPPSTGTGEVSPVVSSPGGSTQVSPNTGVNGVQTSPVSGIESLPSTSTDGAPTAPLAALGLAMMALGGALLRRRDTQT